MNCVYSKKRINEIKWILPNNSTINSKSNTVGGQSILILANNTLIILNATKHDSGTYTCVIETKNGESYYQFIVNVYGKLFLFLFTYFCIYAN